MTLSAPSSLFTAVTSGAATSNVSGSFTPTAGDLILIAATERSTSSTAPVNSISNTHAGVWTWTKVEVSNGLATNTALAVFMAICPASPGAGTVTVTSSAALATRWRLTGHSVSTTDGAVPTNTKTKNDASATPSITLTNAPAATSMTVGWVSAVGVTNPTVGPGSGFAELTEVGDAVATSLEIETDTTAPGSSMDWTGCGTSGNCLIAIEVKLLTFSATAASTMAPAVSAAVATETFRSTAASTMAPAVSAAVATETFSATAASTMAVATSAAVAAETFAATAASTMAAATSSAVATETFSAVTSSTMAPVVTGAASTETFSAEAASTMAAATSASVATLTFSAVASSTMAPAVSASAALGPVEQSADIGGSYVPYRKPQQVVTAKLRLTANPPRLAITQPDLIETRLALVAPCPTLRVVAHRGPTPAELHYARQMQDDERLLELLDMAA